MYRTSSGSTVTARSLLAACRRGTTERCSPVFWGSRLTYGASQIGFAKGPKNINPPLLFVSLFTCDAIEDHHVPPIRHCSPRCFY